MIEKIMKAVKSSNKKRGRKITIGAVIGFLLSCTAVMGADEIGVNIIEKNGEIEIDDKGKFSENTFENNTYTNNMTISAENPSNDAYGIKLALSNKTINIINNGLISGHGHGYGYGISNSVKMENIENIGVISGTGYGVSGGAGYGILNDSYSKEMGNITNAGIISGYGYSYSTNYSTGYGYGINNKSGTIGDITNTGVISGTGYGYSSGYAYGILNDANTEKIGNITNIGVISGYGISFGYGIWNYKYGTDSEIKNITNTGIISGYGYLGYGIYNYSSTTMGNITNTGVIYGKTNAIKNNSGTIGTSNNYGILINGKNQDVNDGLTNSTNYGLIIRNNGNNGIGAGVGGEQTVKFGTSEREMTIENETVSNSFSGDKENHILNALKDTYKTTGDKNDEAEVIGSIINAYGTAVVFEGADKKLTLSGTIVNGGIDESDPDTKGTAISGSSNGDNLILQSGKIKYTNGNEVTQNTIVNGNINMGRGADTLTVGDGTIINGTLDGGDEDDTLNFGINSVAKSNPAESEGVRILHNISNFEKMNINVNVTLFEKTVNASGVVEELKITGADKITIGENGTLTLRINSSKMGSADEADKIMGHALYGNTGEIFSTDGGKLLLALNGAGNKEIISFGSTKLNSSLVTACEGMYYEDVTFGTTSLIHFVKRVNGTENEVEITVKKNLPLKTLKYEKLNKIYHGILSVDDLIGNFNVDSDEKLSTFLGYLNDIYARNLYSYSSELSRKSVGMFRDIAVESQFKPELNKWLIMGGLTHVDGGTKDTYYGKGYYTYDIGSSDMDADTKITGAYMLGEYGVSDTLTYGVVIGGNKLKSDLSNGSKVDGDALYMGAYAKKYIGNLKVTGGLGLQYGDYDADRFAAGKGITETRSYSDNYNDMTYDIYLNGRYSHNLGENLFLEPYGTLSYTYVDQEGTDEGSKVLAIETDSKSFDYTAAKVGLDLKKVIPHEKGKSTLSAGISYTRLLTGADEENITGRFKGENASNFDILVAHKNEHSIELNAKYTLELENGILFDVKESYNVERDSHNGSGKNRNKDEWIVGAGLGYKF